MSLKEPNRFERVPASVPQAVVYPAQFHFRIITEAVGFNEARLVAAMAPYQVTVPLAVSRSSTAGRYRAYSLSVEIRNQAELREIDGALKRVPGVRMVL